MCSFITKSSWHTLSSVAHTSNKGIQTGLKWSPALGLKQLENSKSIIHKKGHGWDWEVVTYKRWSHMEVWLYLLFFNLSSKAWKHYLYLQLDRRIFLHSIIKYSHTHLAMAEESFCLLNEVLCLQKPSRWFHFHFPQKPHFFRCDLDPFFPGEEEWNLK